MAVSEQALQVNSAFPHPRGWGESATACKATVPWAGAKQSTREIIRAALGADDSVPQEVVRHIERLLSGEVEVGVSNDPKLLTMAAAARRLGVSRTWFWQKVTAEGNSDEAAFPPVEIAPGSYRYRRSDIDAFSKRRASYLPKRRAIEHTQENKKSKGGNDAFGD